MHLQSCVCRHLTGWSSTTLAGISQWYRIRMHEVDKWHERREIIAKRLQRFSLKLNNSHDTYTYNAKSCIIILTSYCTLSGTTATIVSSERKKNTSIMTFSHKVFCISENEKNVVSQKSLWEKTFQNQIRPPTWIDLSDRRITKGFVNFFVQ